jgi:ABC-type multidrug transport system ATPase subunit
VIASPPALEVRELVVAAGGRALVRASSLTLSPGELVALIGPSGAGKTTLLNALAGVVAPYAGAVLLGGEPVNGQAPEVGHVSSDDLLHDQLTVREELIYAAALRSGDLTGDAELEDRVAAVLADLRLVDVAQSRVATLSRGERRRTSCGVELVGSPAILLLDEPAGGLDAGLERRLMELLRRLADGGRGVIAATHATASLALCDRVLVLGPGGVLRFSGSPSDLTGFFGVSTAAAVYERLELDAAQAPAPELLPQPSRPAARGRAPRSRPRPGLVRQLGIVVPRAVLCRMRDRRSLAVLLGQAPVIGVAIAIVLPHGAVADTALGPYYSLLLAFMLLTACIWMGTTAACREFVGDRAIARREVAVGLRLDAYLIGRCLTLLPFVALQTLLLVTFVLTLQPAPEGELLVVLTCVVVSWSAACAGLWLSAASDTADQATGIVPLMLIPHLLFAGALIPVARLPLPLQGLSDVTIGHWALIGLGHALGLDQRLGSTLASVSGLDGSYFAVRPLMSLAAIAGLGAIALVGTSSALARRLGRPPVASS